MSAERIAFLEKLLADTRALAERAKAQLDRLPADSPLYGPCFEFNCMVGEADATMVAELDELRRAAAPSERTTDG